MLRIMTVEFDPIKKGFDDASIKAFFAGKSLTSIKKSFFKQSGRYYWTFAIEYEQYSIEKSDEIILESDKQKDVYIALKEWRNDLAAEKGNPPYVIFTNNQLKQIAIANPTNVDSIKNIRGIGSKKASEYANNVLAIISENSVKADENK